MHIMKIRRVGNSNVVSLPHVLEQLGYTAGTTVLVAAMPDGALHIVPTERVRAVMQDPDPPGAAGRHDALLRGADAARNHAVDPSSRNVPT
jgi:hypothetical protein